METASSASPAALGVSGSLDVTTPSRAPVSARALSMTARSPPRWICGGRIARGQCRRAAGPTRRWCPIAVGKTLAMDVGDGRSPVEVVDLVSQKRRSSPVDLTSSAATAGNGTNGAGSRAETGRSSRGDDADMGQVESDRGAPRCLARASRRRAASVASFSRTHRSSMSTGSNGFPYQVTTDSMRPGTPPTSSGGQRRSPPTKAG